MLALLIAVSATAIAIESDDFCAQYRQYEACASQEACDWCGNKSFSPPTALCYKKNPALTCCAETVIPANFFCAPTAKLCNSTSKCSVEMHETSYGPCPSTACCPDSHPVPCDGECLTVGSQCCGGGMSCNATQYCCGGEFVGLACCKNEGDQCCESPDGYSHWCCASTQDCNVNGGCDSV